MSEMTPRPLRTGSPSSQHTLSGVPACALLSSSCRAPAPSSGSPQLILNQNSEPQTSQRLLRRHREEGLERGHLTWVPVLMRVMGARILTACRSCTSTSTRSWRRSFGAQVGGGWDGASNSGLGRDPSKVGGFHRGPLRRHPQDV